MNSELANAVINLAESGRFFAPIQGGGDRFPYRVENFHEALSISRLSEGEIIEPNYQSLLASFIQNETRIRDGIYARNDWSKISDLEDEACAKLEKAVQRVPDTYREAIDDVLAHLSICWLSRLTVGYDPFFEKIFEAYLYGFWPCGWIDAGSHSEVNRTGQPKQAEGPHANQNVRLIVF